jgi:glutathione-regulated potassium-efflux system ancillary protein KefC
MEPNGFLQQALIYLAAGVIAVPLFARLGLGSVLGYLAAGVAIGPWGLGLIHSPQTVFDFAEFGVVMLLFLIGLELEPERLWALRRSIFGMGATQVLATGAAVALAALALGQSVAVAVVCGMGFAMSSTAIGLATLQEKNLLATPGGQASFAVLLFQDLSVIPLLLVVGLLGQGKTSLDWMKVAIAIGLIVVIVAGGRFALRPLLRVIAGARLRETFVAFALLLVLGIAALMEAVGLSMALGAFLAGVLLADSEYRHELELDIEPFKGLLLGLFFIAVGMSIDFGLVASRPLEIVALVVGLLAVKALALRALGGALRVAAGDRWLFAALLAQGGEFAFVVFGVAGRARLLPGSWDALLTLVVALSMALTPFLLLAHDRLSRRRGAARPDDVVEDEGAPVIIAGFGRFGQIVGRMLFASRIRATVLDHDADQIETLRKFGFRIFYGDATRLDLLHAAGAEHAKLLVLAIDDPEASVRLAEVVRQNFPNLKVVARARNISHWVELRKQGVEAVERETFESALRSGRAALERLGVAPYEARERADRFRRQNLAVLEDLMPHFEDETRRLSSARAGREQLEQQFAEDKAALDRAVGTSWSAEADRNPERVPAPESVPTSAES